MRALVSSERWSWRARCICWRACSWRHFCVARVWDLLYCMVNPKSLAFWTIMRACHVSLLRASVDQIQVLFQSTLRRKASVKRMVVRRAVKLLLVDKVHHAKLSAYAEGKVSCVTRSWVHIAPIAKQAMAENVSPSGVSPVVYTRTKLPPSASWLEWRVPIVYPRSRNTKFLKCSSARPSWQQVKTLDEIKCKFLPMWSYLFSAKEPLFKLELEIEHVMVGFSSWHVSYHFWRHCLSPLLQDLLTGNFSNQPVDNREQSDGTCRRRICGVGLFRKRYGVSLHHKLPKAIYCQLCLYHMGNGQKANVRQTFELIHEPSIKSAGCVGFGLGQSGSPERDIQQLYLEWVMIWKLIKNSNEILPVLRIFNVFWWVSGPKLVPIALEMLSNNSWILSDLRLLHLACAWQRKICINHHSSQGIYYTLLCIHSISHDVSHGIYPLSTIYSLCIHYKSIFYRNKMNYPKSGFNPILEDQKYDKSMLL